MLDVFDRAVAADHRIEPRLDETRVGRHVQALDPRDDLVAQAGVEMDAVHLEQLFRRVVIALSLDPLDVGEQPADAFPEGLRIDHHVVGLGVPAADLDGVRVGHQPVHDHLPVAHMVFFDLRALTDTAKLHQRVARVAFILRLHDFRMVFS